MKPRLVIGIAGGTGSGKSTLVERLLSGPDGKHISLLPHDAYYHSSNELPLTEDGAHNWDHPDALDNALYLDHIELLMAGKSINRPVYDFSAHRRALESIEVQPRPVLLLEGILLLAIPAIRDCIDLRVYIDTPADLRVMRRTIRDIDARGRSARSVADQYQSTVRPMHEQYVEPSRFAAHVWIPWITDNPEAVKLLSARIDSALRES